MCAERRNEEEESTEEALLEEEVVMEDEGEEDDGIDNNKDDESEEEGEDTIGLGGGEDVAALLSLDATADVGPSPMVCVVFFTLAPTCSRDPWMEARFVELGGCDFFSFFSSPFFPAPPPPFRRRPLLGTPLRLLGRRLTCPLPVRRLASFSEAFAEPSSPSPPPFSPPSSLSFFISFPSSFMENDDNDGAIEACKALEEEIPAAAASCGKKEESPSSMVLPGWVCGTPYGRLTLPRKLLRLVVVVPTTSVGREEGRDWRSTLPFTPTAVAVRVGENKMVVDPALGTGKAAMEEEEEEHDVVTDVVTDDVEGGNSTAGGENGAGNGCSTPSLGTRPFVFVGDIPDTSGREECDEEDEEDIGVVAGGGVEGGVPFPEGTAENDGERKDIKEAEEEEGKSAGSTEEEGSGGVGVARPWLVPLLVVVSG